MAERNIVDAPITASPDKASLFEDFIDIFVAPSKVYARRANSGFWLILLIVSVISAVLLFAGRSTVDSILEAQMLQTQAQMAEQNPNMTEDQLAAMRNMGTSIGKVMMYVGTPLFILVLGLVVWLVGKIFGAAFTYTAGALIVAYSFIPRLLQTVAWIVQGLLLEPSSATMAGLSFSPARFMDPATTSMGMMGLLMRFDIFVIWATILIGIGISVIGRVPREKGYLAAAVIWMLGTLPAIWGAVMS